MSESLEVFAARYAAEDDAALLALARRYDSLIETAQTALRAEFARRGLEVPLVEGSEESYGSRRLVTVARYRDLSEAIVARSLLESAGLWVSLRDENLVRLDWQISNFIGGLRLEVEAENVDAARDLLAQPVPEGIGYADGAVFEQPHCPVCGSVEITFEGASRGAALTSMYMLGLPLPTGWETWRCEVCEARWEDPDDPGGELAFLREGVDAAFELVAPPAAAAGVGPGGGDGGAGLAADAGVAAVVEFEAPGSGARRRRLRPGAWSSRRGWRPSSSFCRWGWCGLRFF